MGCSAEGCEKENKRKGFCEAHYYKEFRKAVKEFDVDEYWLFVKKELKIG
jgi:hypothetical protein